MKRHPSTNRLYRIIWSEARQAWVVASELSQGHCKTGGNHLLACADLQTNSDARLRHSIAHIFGVSLLGVSVAYATPGINELPSGGQISQGSGSISQNGNTLTVQQNSDKMIGQWNTFNIGEQATVNVQQPNAHSIALNRIHDSKPSEIYGKLNANGQIYLLNSNGVIFGKTAQVDVGGIVATTHHLGDKDFLNGNLVLTQQNALGKIDNQGRITAHGGLIAFIAPQVSNSGSLQNTGGTVALAAGEQVTLDFQGDGLIKVKVDKAALNALAENKGLIQADGGTVIMTAQSANALMDSVVNNDGVIQAHTLANRKGRIVLDGGDEGVTRVAGTLDAGAPSLAPVNTVKTTAVGGTIIATGNKIRIDEDAHLSASGKTGGGKVLIGGSWQNSNHSLRQASATIVAKTAKLEANATGRGKGGTVVVGSDASKADSVTRAYGTFEAQGGPNGGNGGRIQTSGHWLDVAGSQIDASTPNGKAGRWLFAAGTAAITDANADSASGSALGNDIWTSNTSPSTLLNTDISSRLETGTDVTVSAQGGGTEIGDITVSSAITKTSGDTDTTLTLQAANSIVVDQAIGNTGGSGKLHVALAAGNGGGSVLLNNNISTQGGDITFGTAAATGGDVYVGGDSAVSLTTSGGSVTVNGEMIIANTRGLTIDSSNGNVSFGGSVNSGNRYTGVSSTLDWSSALADAASGAGQSVGDSYLATLTSRSENAVAAHSVNYRAAWLGARRIAKIGSDNAWRWVSGPEGLHSGDGLIFFYQDSGNTAPGLYSNWSGGQPDNYGGAANLSDEAQSALQFSRGFGRWNDYATGNKLNYYVRETNLAASPLTVNAGSGTVTFSGAVGDNKALAALKVASTGAIAVNGGAVTTEGLQTYDGNLTLGSSRTVLTQTNANTDFKLRSGSAIYSAGLSNSLTINTTDDIILGNSSSIGSFIGALNVTLNSDSDATGGGAILMHRGSAIAGKGGDIALNADRLTLAGTSRLQASGKLTVQPRTAVTIGIADGAGALSLPASYFSSNFNGFSGITVGNATAKRIRVGNTALSFNDPLTLKTGNSIFFGSSSALTGNGNSLTLWTRAGGSAAGDDGVEGSVRLPTGSSIATGGGSVTIGGGIRGPGLGYALGNNSPCLINCENNARYRGVTINGSIDAGGGNVSILGRGASTVNASGVSIGGTVSTTGSGAVTIDGMGNGEAAGVVVGDNYPGSENPGYIGAISTQDGNLTLRGSQNTGGQGINIRASGNAVTATGRGNILLEAVTGGITVQSTATISTGTGNLTLTADALDINGTLSGSGQLRIQAKTPGTSIGIAGSEGRLNLPASYFSTNFVDGFSGITVGNRNSGAITVGDAVTFNDNTALISGNTIAINGAINAVGQTLTLTGGSGKTVSGSGDISADKLLLNGSRTNYLLNTAPHNNVGIVAATGVSKLAYRDSDTLEIGTVSGVSGISAGGFVDIATQSGDLTLAQKLSAFALTLNAGEATAAGTSTGGNIVVNGLPRITALFGAKLFTGSVSGSTGLSALIGSGRGGFRYNSDESASHYSAALGLGKYAIYREQPMLSVTPGSATGTYGEAVSTAAVSAKITNFVNGDNASQAGISGTAEFITTADNHSRVGVYDIAYNGGLSNALGYGITDATDSLGEYSITPRILNITATGQNKVYDGTATATVTLHDNRIADDNLLLSNTGANFIDGNTATGKLIEVNGITITGADAANYIFNTSTTAIADIEPNPASTSIITSVLGSAQQTTIKVTTDAGLTVGSATLAIMSNGALIVDNSVDSPTAPLAQPPSPGNFTAPAVPVSAPVQVNSPIASAATAQTQERPRTRRRADSDSQKNITLEQPAAPAQSAPESASQKTVEAAKTTLSDGLTSIKSGVNGVDTLQTALFEAAVGQGLPRQQAEQASNSFVRVLVQNLAKGKPLSVATKLAQGAFNSVTGTPRPSSPQAVAAGSLAGSGLGSGLSALSGATTPSGSAAFDASLSAGLAKGKSLDQAVQSARNAVQQIDAAITMDHSPMGSLSNGGAEGLADTPLSVQNSLSNALAKGISMEQALQRAYAAGIAADEAAKVDARRPGSGLSSGNSASIKALPATGDFDKTLGVAMSRGISIEQAITHAIQINALQQQGVNADAKSPLAGFANGRQLSDRDNKHFDKALTSALARGLAPAAAIDRARQAVQNLQTEAQSLSTSLASGKNIDTLLSSLGHSRIFDKILGKALARGVPPDEAVNLAQRAEAAGALHFQLPSRLTSAIPANSQVEITTGSGAPLPSWLRYMPETHQLMAYDIPPGALPMQVIMTVNGKPATVEITETGIRL